MRTLCQVRFDGLTNIPITEERPLWIAKSEGSFFLFRDRDGETAVPDLLAVGSEYKYIIRIKISG